MADDIPQWAIERAKALQAASKRPGLTPVMHTFARYIAEHEEPPVDPLLIEAREIVAAWLEAHPDKQARGKWTPEMTRSGKLDDDASVVQALTALKRGIEIGKESK